MNESIEVIKEDILALDEKLTEAALLIKIAEDAGEDVSVLKGQFRRMQTKQKKWKDAIEKNS